LVVAASSGQGYFSLTKSVQSFLNLINRYKRCTLLNFTKEEVELYIKIYNGGPFTHAEDLNKITCFNPYLISLYVSSNEDFPTTSGHYIEKFISSLFGDIERYGNLQTFCQIQFQDLYTWLCKADNGIICNNNALVEFKRSFAARSYILFYRMTSVSEFKVVHSLPCSNLLCREVTGHYMKLPLPLCVSDVPIIKGFYYEDIFFAQVMRDGFVNVKLGDEIKRYTVNHVLSDKCDSAMIGVLYHLNYTYPVIDGVGYLKCNNGRENDVAVLFIQVSLSKYYNHSTKLEDLLEYPAPDDAGKTIFDHYLTLCPKSYRIREFLYVYVCTKGSSRVYFEKRKHQNILYSEVVLQYQ